MQAGGIDERHLTHADDAHLGILAEARHHLLGTVACPEEIRTVDFVHLYALGDGEMLQVAGFHIGILVEVNLIVDGTHLAGLAHASHEEQTGADEPYLDGDGQVEDDGQQERQDEHGDVALGVLQHGQERTPSAHAIAHHHKHARQTSHRNILRQGHQEEEDEQEHHGMHDAGHRCASAVVDVGHGAGNGSGCGNAAENGRHDVGQPLPYQLGVRTMMVAYHTVGHGGREQTLYGTQYGDGHGRSCQSLDGVPGEARHFSPRQLRRNAEAVANGLDSGHAGIVL